MDIKKIIELASNPKPYEKGTAVMWTDEYISRQLLEMHLNPDTDAASRKKETINNIVNWISDKLDKKNAKILDLGCGPGLYTEKLSKLGHQVTGVDFSRNSISYARKSAEQKGLDIRYLCKDYLELDFKNEFDLVMMIYCDFGVLSDIEREKLLCNVYGALRNGGIFIFDALNIHVLESMKFQRSWECAEKGFWMDKPYICLRESLHYPDKRAVMDQHIVIDENNGYEVYRFWNHYFDINCMRKELIELGFCEAHAYSDLLNGKTPGVDNGVTFYKAVK